MGKDKFYLDDFANASNIQKIARECYIPTNKILLKQLTELKGKFKVSFSISGLAIEQFKQYAPEVIDSFKELADTGYVEFLTETYSHSLASLTDAEEFAKQVKRQSALITKTFGKRPKTFRNTELIYSDGIGKMASDLGYNNIVTEGAKHILGWKSPNFVYADSSEPKIKLLLRNYSLSDDLCYRFSDHSWDHWPLTAEKYVSWIANGEGEVTNIFLDYDTFGEHQKAESGIFEFLEALAPLAVSQGLEFKTPAEVTKKFQPISAINIPYPISWADEERDTTSWLGNELQREAFEQLYSVSEKVAAVNDENLNSVWDFLQASNHFYYMSTKWFAGGSTENINPYDSPYEAFINFMNVTSDFIREINIAYDAKKSKKRAPRKSAEK